MKVYAVEAGSYSDRWIVGVWSDEDNADAVAREYDACVMDFDLDEPLSEKAARLKRPGIRTYHVTMEARSGQYARAQPIFQQTDLDERSCSNGTLFGTGCWATSEEEAIKIANDRRTAWLAGGAETRGARRGLVYPGWNFAWWPGQPE